MSTLQKITITEALAEIKLITKKLESKGKFVTTNLTRYKHVPDKIGDSEKKLNEEMQSINDLYKRMVKIRNVISKANLANTIKIADEEMPITDWLSWKREVAQGQKILYLNIQSTLKREIDKVEMSPQGYKDADGNNKFFELVCNLSYPEYVTKTQEVQEKLDKLDGLLSLKNATIVVEV